MTSIDFRDIYTRAILAAPSLPLLITQYTMPVPTTTATTTTEQPTLKLRGAKTQASTAVFPDLEAKGVSHSPRSNC